MNQDCDRKANRKKIRTWERWGIVAILLLAWALRWVALMEVPPGWRDDDLIELYTFSYEILETGPVLYLPGASGHEPFYHTIRAPLLAVAGLNQASARWLAAIFALWSVLLTWSVGRRLFTRGVGMLSAALVAVSFWSLMYSRVAIRHIGALPWMLMAIYWGWRILHDERPPRGSVVGLTVGVALAFMTYYAGRVVPALLLVALPFVKPRPGRWKLYLAGIGAGLLLAAPIFWALLNVPGSDARVDELAGPIRALMQGDLNPVWEMTRTTLGMFHATGDPEWLYNISGRPVFGILGAILFFLGIATRLAHLDQPNARFVLLWLLLGIAPAFISIPPSSYGHTILALPATYILISMPMKAAARRWPRTALPLAALTLLVVAARDLPDYFVTWNEASMVRFLYRGDYRDLTEYLDAHGEIDDAVVSSMLFGPWDQVAVETDRRREDMRLRWVNPERALVGEAEGRPLPLYLQEENPRHPRLQALIDAAPAVEAPEGLEGVRLALPEPPEDVRAADESGEALATQPFAGALRLEGVAWEPAPAPGREAWAATWWQVTGELPLPERELLPHPPPPDVYNGPRLKVFAHLYAGDGTLLLGDDGLWVDPYSLEFGDRILQWHRFALPEDAPPGPYTLALGIYDPLTGERWPLPSGRDVLRIPAEE